MADLIATSASSGQHSRALPPEEVPSFLLALQGDYRRLYELVTLGANLFTSFVIHANVLPLTRPPGSFPTLPYPPSLIGTNSSWLAKNQGSALL